MMTGNSGISAQRGQATARGALVLLAMVLLPLVATLQTPRPGAAQAVAQDSLWADGIVSNGTVIGACANPSSPAALASCFSSPVVPPAGVNPIAMATDGVNVYYAPGPDLGGGGGLSCPIADLGANCTRIMAGPWPAKWDGGNANSVNAIAAAGGQIWIGQPTGEIYRCPANLPYQKQDSAPSQCVKLDDAGARGVMSLLLANNRLYAGLGTYKKQGLLWSCDPQTVNACFTLDSYGNTRANSLDVGGGYLWAGLQNGILWRCDLNQKDRCADWATMGGSVESVSHDGQGTLYAAAATGIWSCQTASASSAHTADACSKVLSNVTGNSVAAGAGGVFSSTSDSPPFHFGTTAYSSGYSSGTLLYIPAGGPVGVGGVSLEVSAQKLSRKLEKRCSNRGKSARVLVAIEGPHGVSKTVKAGACALARGGTVKQTFDLLDLGRYTVTVTAGKRTVHGRFEIAPDTTTQVKLKLMRAPAHG